MKGASLALLGVLAALHWLEGDGAVALPLSMFRDGKNAGLGYSAFALLIFMGIVMTRAAHRSGDSLTCRVYGVGTIMLALVAATPSIHPFHILVSLALPAIFQAFYFRLLYSVAGSWRALLPSVPLLLLLVPSLHSYGALQKSMILYVVVLANLHYGLLSRPWRTNARKRTDSGTSRNLDRLIAEGWVENNAPVPRPCR